MSGAVELRSTIILPGLPYWIACAVADDGMGGQDLENDIAVFVNLNRVADRFTTGGGKVIQLFFGNIVTQNFTAALFYNILCHGQSHNAHP